jgi:ribosome biogenesis GTPase / thiamine phosphate phosphatase
LVGSSGVGKSTLINTLTGALQATANIREDDAHGRHTTVSRSLHRLAAGGWLLDTPGMRELQLTDVESGIDDVFADIVDLARQCRFSDCGHETEPGCAVRAAIEAGRLDADRLKRFEKLVKEERRNSEDLRQRHERERDFGKMVRDIVKTKKKTRGE